MKNYTGDRLNFGLAAERARAFGLKVAMEIVDDDIALPDLPQARGVAGTLFVYKIAGAMAEARADLETIASAAQAVIRGAVSIGMSLDTCTVPGSPKEDRIDAGKAELGLGIHGEAGVEQVSSVGAKAALGMVVDRLLPQMASGDHVVLLNNLGGTTPLEMSVLAEELGRFARRGQRRRKSRPQRGRLHSADDARQGRTLQLFVARQAGWPQRSGCRSGGALA